MGSDGPRADGMPAVPPAAGLVSTGAVGVPAVRHLVTVSESIAVGTFGAPVRSTVQAHLLDTS